MTHTPASSALVAAADFNLTGQDWRAFWLQVKKITSRSLLITADRYRNRDQLGGLDSIIKLHPGLINDKSEGMVIAELRGH